MEHQSTHHRTELKCCVHNTQVGSCLFHSSIKSFIKRWVPTPTLNRVLAQLGMIIHILTIIKTSIKKAQCVEWVTNLLAVLAILDYFHKLKWWIIISSLMWRILIFVNSFVL